MQTLKYFLVALVAIFVSTKSFSQSKPLPAGSKTEVIIVSGNCGMCRERIEAAAKMDGVSQAEWNKDTKKLTLVYNPSRIKTEDIQKKIAASGHDTGKFKAEDKTYNSLPGCCKYR